MLENSETKLETLRKMLDEGELSGIAEYDYIKMGYRKYPQGSCLIYYYEAMKNNNNSYSL